MPRGAPWTGVRLTVPTVRPAAVIARRASASLRPTTPGTSTWPVGAPVAVGAGRVGAAPVAVGSAIAVAVGGGPEVAVGGGGVGEAVGGGEVGEAVGGRVAVGGTGVPVGG